MSFANTSANASAAAELEDPNSGSERFFPHPVKYQEYLYQFKHESLSTVYVVRIKLINLPSNALQNGRFPL